MEKSFSKNAAWKNPQKIEWHTNIIHAFGSTFLRHDSHLLWPSSHRGSSANKLVSPDLTFFSRIRSPELPNPTWLEFSLTRHLLAREIRFFIRSNISYDSLLWYRNFDSPHWSNRQWRNDFRLDLNFDSNVFLPHFLFHPLSFISF